MNNNGKNKKVSRINKAPKKHFFKKKKIKDPRNMQRVKERDKRCLNCSSEDNLSAHHVIFGKGKKDDSMTNLITLCFTCHRKAHDGFNLHTRSGTERVSGKRFVLSVLYRMNDKDFEQTILELEKK